MKFSELTNLSEKELHEKLAETRKEYADSQRAHAAGELANPRVLTNQRRQIAQVKTAIAAKIKGKDGDDA